MSDVTKNELLINALLDDQLDATEAQRVRQQISSDRELSAMLASFEEQRDRISELPKFKLGNDFASRIVEIGEAEAAAVPMMNRPVAPVSKVDWKRYAMSLAAIAALLMGMLVYQWTPTGQETAALTPAAGLSSKSNSAYDDAVGATDKSPMDNLPMESNADSPFELPLGGKFSGSVDAAPFPEADAYLAAPTPPMTRTEKSSPKMQSRAKQNYAFDESDNEGDNDAEDSDAEGIEAAEGFALRGTSMSAPETQTRPPIDQVWLMEVGESYSQNQLVEALTSNRISVPAELQSVASESGAEISLGSEVDGIQVAAKRSQMKSALSQLSQSEAVTISAFQLPNQAGLNRLRNSDESELSQQAARERISGSTPASIEAPSRAMAQRLRGSFFARSSPSSKVPNSYSQLEEMMRVDDATKADDIANSNSKKGIVNRASSGEDDRSLSVNNAKEMDELFPGGDADSEAFSNFVIIIRNEAKPAKDEK